MRGSMFRLLVLVAATVVAIGLNCRQASARDEVLPTCAGLEPGPERTVTRILDGETVALDDGTELRLIGALAPRAIDAGAEPGMWPAEIAAAEELRALLVGKSVELAYGGERSDRYGRIQAHAYVREGDGRRWVQGHLLEQGLARAYVVAGNRACADALLAAERGAREARRGLWADAAYQVTSADKPTQLAALPQHVPACRRPHRRRRNGARHDLSQLRCRLAARVLGFTSARRPRLSRRRRRQAEGAGGKARPRPGLDRAAAPPTPDHRAVDGGPDRGSG